MNHPIDLGYLNSLYAGSADPWHLRGTWYEQRKLDLLMGCLLRQRYHSAFEPGCSIGEMTARLAGRCDSVLAADFHPDAVRSARLRVQAMANVRIEQLLLPEQWPTNTDFDLIVISEIGYFFTATAWEQLCRKVAASAAPDATVLACHWRHNFAERTLPTVQLHAVLDKSVSWPRRSYLRDEDFLIEVWSNTDHRSYGSEPTGGAR